ncbi:hypothetical protein [Clostridium paraputrificum]|uniref:hypothetical protein n=1 Tax=Clostridium paraputrificum TaxID=29363 RepID=UPI003561FFEF
MKLKIRYENEFQTIELDAKATEEMWVTLSIETDGAVTQDEKEQLIQEEWDKQFNRPEYNSWHKADRHRGYSCAKSDDEDEEMDDSEPLMKEVRDPSIFLKDEIERNNKMDYEMYCEKIRAAVKPAQAEMLISIALDGMTVADYAELIGDKPNNVSHRYRAALKKLEKSF